MANLLRLVACLFVLLSFNAFAVDTDGDGIDDENDNCPLIANLECSWLNGQYTCIMPDTDSDGIGDACETFEVEINAFQNGQIADANDVNENFNNLKQAVEELKEIIDKNNCLAHKGTIISGVCESPEIDIEKVEILSAVQNIIITSFDTSEFVFANSNYIRVEMYVDGEVDATCNLKDPSDSIIASVSNTGSWEERNNEVENIPIQIRGLHYLSCSFSEPTLFDEVEIKFFKGLVSYD